MSEEDRQRYRELNKKAREAFGESPKRNTVQLEAQIESQQAEIERLQGELKDDRKVILLKATYDILKKCDDSRYVLDVMGQTAFWDETDCDGFCLMAEIADELDITEDES